MRDVLIGAAVGLAIAAWQIGFYLFRGWLGDPSLKPAVEPANWHLGVENFVEGFTSQLGTPLLDGFAITFLILLLALLLRRDWLAFALGGLIFTTGLAFLGGATIPSWINSAVTAGLLIFLLYRHGLLKFMASLAFLHMNITFPVTIHLTAWYATGFVIDLIILLAVAFYAFHTSLAGQPVFGGKLLQED
ncbi:MAG: hypothetical protein ACRD9S_16060 [Pyrinomonadaceae bacterium]